MTTFDPYLNLEAPDPGATAEYFSRDLAEAEAQRQADADLDYRFVCARPYLDEAYAGLLYSVRRSLVNLHDVSRPGDRIEVFVIPRDAAGALVNLGVKRLERLTGELKHLEPRERLPIGRGYTIEWERNSSPRGPGGRGTDRILILRLESPDGSGRASGPLVYADRQVPFARKVHGVLKARGLAG